MTDLPRILVIDDDPGLRAVLKATLGKDYAVTQAIDGQAGIAAARQSRPDLILLDITMPGMTGYETCMQLKRDELTRAAPIVFLSALAELDDRLAAYAAGGEDFIGKPFDPEELAGKVRVALGRADDYKRLLAEKDAAFAMAMTAMASAGEIGVVMAFMRRTFACADHEQLADAVIGACATLDLYACIQIRAGAGTVSRNRYGASSPMETSVLTTLAECGHIVTLGDHLAINFSHVTLMVTNLPIADPDRAGRLRDDLAWLAEVADGKVATLDYRLEVVRQRGQLAHLIERTHAALTDIDHRHQGQKASAVEIMHRLADELETSLYGLGLSEGQEAAVSTTLRHAVEQVLRLFGEGLAIDQHLRAIAAELAVTGEAEKT